MSWLYAGAHSAILHKTSLINLAAFRDTAEIILLAVIRDTAEIFILAVIRDTAEIFILAGHVAH